MQDADHRKIKDCLIILDACADMSKALITRKNAWKILLEIVKGDIIFCNKVTYYKFFCESCTFLHLDAK